MQVIQSEHFKADDIIGLLKALGETDMPFDAALQVKTTPHHHLMDIWGVSVDANNRLWVRTSRKDEVEINNSLLYSQYILGSLSQRLRLLLYFKQQLAK